MVFCKMPLRNNITWNAMITACVQNEHFKEALEVYLQMLLEGLRPSKITFVCVLDACANMAALDMSEDIHANILDSGFELDDFLGSAVINMYAKCGKLDKARITFGSIPEQNVVVWNAMIAAYTQNGHGNKALELYQQMQLKAIKPDAITFVSILSACNHTGNVEDGRSYFVSMNSEFGLKHTVEHYECMIDILGRTGQLDEAEDLIGNAPFQYRASAWLRLLGACRIHGDVKRAEHAADRVFELDPKNSAPYVLLSNIYAAAGMWGHVAKVRESLNNSSVKRKPGSSYIEVNKKVHEFTAGDLMHSQKDEIYAELERLSRQMEEAGFVSHMKSALHHMQEETEEHMLTYHSEKLAIAFGLISTSSGTPICITKNLRVCEDCHAAIKCISNISCRKILVRDVNHFHRFEHGMCSCADY